MHKVFAGSFKSRENAEKRVNEIKAKTGINAFILTENVGSSPTSNSIKSPRY